MPVKSPAQFRFMEGIKNGMKPNKGIGPSPQVATDFLSKTPKKKKSQFARAPKSGGMKMGLKMP